MTMKKPFLFKIMFLFCFQIISAQNPANVNGCSIWIKHSTNVSNSSIKTEIDSLNFNSEINFIEKDKTIVNKDKLKPSFTLFVVYKSNEEKEKDIINYTVGNELLRITNKEILSSSGLEYSKHKSNNGVIVEYSANLKAVKNSNICILSFPEKISEVDSSEQKKTSILEFIFYPRVLSVSEKLKIESYLSIKYGISLVGETNYLSSNSAKVWNFEQNKLFNNNVTGIARDDKSELFQKQSVNTIKKGLSIGFGNYDSISKVEKTDLDDSTYLVWGDNNKNTSFNQDINKNINDSIVKMKREWKMQFSSYKIIKSPKSFVLINLKDFFINYKAKKGYILWLATTSNCLDSFDYSNATFYPSQPNTEDILVFNNIVWDKDKNGADGFTFVQAPEMFILDTLIDKDCNLSINAKINLKVVGGIAPFELSVKHDEMTLNFKKNTRNFEIETPTFGNYEATLVDAQNQSFSKTINVNSFETIKDFSSSDWLLNQNSELEIAPLVDLFHLDTKYTFSWQVEDKIISSEKTLKVVNPGVYILKITTDKGCQKNLVFNVFKKVSDNNNITLYPNPVSNIEPFNLKFNLEKPSDVEIKIFSITGALLRSEKINTVSTYNFSQILQTSGSYLIVITTNSFSTTYKLIVN